MADMPAKPRRRFLQFSLRAVLVVTLLLSIAAAWLAYQLRIVVVRRQSLESLALRGATIQPPYTWQNAFGYTEPEGCDPVVQNGEVPLVREWLGDRGVELIELPFKSTERDRAHIASIFPEACVELFHPERH
jgi:hypothetical protein